MEPRERTFRLMLDGIKGARMSAAGSDAAPSGVLQITAKADAQHTLKVYITADPENLNGVSTPLKMTIRDTAGTETAGYDAVFNAPAN